MFIPRYSLCALLIWDFDFGLVEELMIRLSFQGYILGNVL
jgi:hypothetical protein